MSVLDEMSQTDMSPFAYAEQKGVRCPVCRAEELADDGLHAVGPDLVLARIKCLACLATWDEEYYLTTYSDLKHGDAARHTIEEINKVMRMTMKGAR